MLIAYLGFGSLAGAAVCLVLLILRAIRRRRKLPTAVALCVCLAGFVVCVFLTPPASPTVSVAPTPSAPVVTTPAGSIAPASSSPVATPPAGSMAPAPSAPELPSPAATIMPTYDEELATLEEKVVSEVTTALDGYFDQSAPATVTFNPYNGAVLIEAQGSDNLTAAMIRAAMLADIRDTLQVITELDFALPVPPDGEELPPTCGIESVSYSLSFPVIDQYGNTANSIVLKATYDRATLDAINWARAGAVDFAAVADEFWSAPALEEG